MLSWMHKHTVLLIFSILLHQNSQSKHHICSEYQHEATQMLNKHHLSAQPRFSNFQPTHKYISLILCYTSLCCTPPAKLVSFLHLPDYPMFSLLTSSFEYCPVLPHFATKSLSPRSSFQRIQQKPS